MKVLLFVLVGTSAVGAFSPKAPPSLLRSIITPTKTSTSLASGGNMVEFAKGTAIALAFGGGLIPALISGNIGMIRSLSGSNRMEEYTVPENPESSLDPSYREVKYRTFVDSSETPGPTLGASKFMSQNGNVQLIDIIAIMGRIPDLDAVADWKNLPSGRREGVSSVNPPLWLPRVTFKVNMRKAPFRKWPVDPKTNEPIGGEDCQRQYEKTISKKGYMISDAALDAVWDSWSGGSGIATPDKVEKALQEYHPTVDTLDLNALVRRSIGGKSVSYFAALTFVLMQIMAIGVIFVAPTLRAFFDIDIGFGQFGTCNPETCTKLF